MIIVDCNWNMDHDLITKNGAQRKKQHICLSSPDVYQSRACLGKSILIFFVWKLKGRLAVSAAVPLVKYFRANGHPTTPIVLAEGTPSGTDWAAPDASATQQGANAIALAAAFKSLVAVRGKRTPFFRFITLFSFRYATAVGSFCQDRLGTDTRPT